jgi:hypothetical protein
VDRWIGQLRPVRRVERARVPVQERRDGVMATVTTAARLVEQVLFVFVASLWPNALPREGEQENEDAPLGEDEEPNDARAENGLPEIPAMVNE